MAPKFRGGSDDWMDDERPSSGRKGAGKPKKNPAAKAVFLEPSEANATVAEVFPKLCRVRLDQDGAEVLCSYRRAGVVGQADAESRERTPVAVGDRVRAQRTSPDAGVVEGVCERRNRLMRPAPGREGQQHVLACNVDVVAIVASLHSPDFSPGLVDRFLVGAQAAGIEPLICVTKVDLGQEEHPGQIYRDLGWPVHEVSAQQGAGIDSLRAALSGKTVVFCGRSGAGKTSLLRALAETDDVGRVGDVSTATGKGKHTTTSAVLIAGPERWIDTPGVREFGLAEIAPERLASFFPELRELACPHSGCLHVGEPGCQATESARLSSYRRILESLQSGEN